MKTHTAQYLGKWHAGFSIGNQSFTLACYEGTKEEAAWYASMMDKAFANARAKDAELIQDLLDSLVLLREVYQSATGSSAPVGNSALAAAEAEGFKPTEQ